MANTNSTQITAINALNKIGSNESHGRIRAAFFDVPAVPTTGVGDTMTLCKIPKGARILRGQFVYSVAQGATATTAIGIASNSIKYMGGSLTNATTAFTFADRINLTNNHGVELSAEETIIATNAGAAWTAAAFRGYIEYVVD